MIRRLSESMAQFFCDKKLFPKDEIDTYAYGYEIMLISVINWGIILIIMLFTGKVIETLLYMFTVIILRHNVGGYHADSHIKCSILSIGSYIVFLIFIFFSGKLSAYISLLVQTLSLAITFLFAPVEHINNPIDETAMKKHRKNGILLSILLYITVIILLYIKMHNLALSISLGVFQVNISLLLGMYRNRGIMNWLKQPLELNERPLFSIY